jgi:arabinofuranosyltransferase
VTARHRISILSLIVVALLLAGLYFYNYMPDDTFITLRYARNVARGDGFVFNPGERLEGYSNFLWLIILVLAAKTGLPLIVASRVLSLLCSIATLTLTFVAAGHAARKTGWGDWNTSLAAGLPAILLASSAPFLTWSLSGTEIPLYTALLLLGFVFLRDDRGLGPVFAIFGLLGLVRPEGLLFYGLAWIILLIHRRNKKEVLLGGTGILLLFYAPYLTWKWFYFGSLLPNTFYAKTGPLQIMLSNGAGYLGGFFASFGYLLLPAALLTGKQLLRERTSFYALIFILAHWTAILFLGGDWMPNYRLLLPTLPLILITVSDGVIAACSRKAGPTIDGVIAACSRKAGPTIDQTRGNPVPLVALMLVLLVILPGSIRYERLQGERLMVRVFARLGQRLYEMLPPQTSLGLGSTGAIGYHTDMKIVDILGLTEKHIARKGHIVASQPGHMKTDGAYVLSRKPDLLLLGNVQIHRKRRSREEMKHKIQEREIIMQPAFSIDYEYVNIPIGRDFYLSCYKRRDYFLPVEGE